MQRLGWALALAGVAPLLAASMAPGRTAPELELLGWRKVVWSGIAPAQFQATPGGGVHIRANSEAAFLYRPLSGAPQCLTWRWRVDAGPPPTDLRRRGGDDRALSIAVGFNGYGSDVGLFDRARHGIAQAAAGDHSLPRSVLSYVWGGSGAEGRGFFDSPWSPAFSRLKVLHPATARQGEWRREKVDLGADWRAAFGSAPLPQVQEVAINTDAEDTGSRVDAQVEDIRMVPCH